MEFRETLSLSNGVKEYEAIGLNGLGFSYPSLNKDNLLENKVRFIESGVLVFKSADSLNEAIEIYKSHLNFNTKNNHGGSRKGAGRKKQTPTKPVRLSVDEQVLIRELRTSNIDKHILVKKLVKFMAVIELDTISKHEVELLKN